MSPADYSSAVWFTLSVLMRETLPDVRGGYSLGRTRTRCCRS